MNYTGEGRPRGGSVYSKIIVGYDGTRRGEDAFVLGSTHRGSLGRVFIGSVGQQLLEDAPCAVAVAPRGFEKAADRQLSSLGVGFDGSPEANVALRHAEALAGTLDASLRAIAAVK